MKEKDPEEIYVEELEELDATYISEKKRILNEYAKAVCPYKKGDVVKDEEGWIRIDKMTVTYRKDNFPLVGVEGVGLTRHKEVRIDGKRRHISIENIIKE